MKLNLYDRITLPTLFPEKTNFSEAIICDDLRQKLKITQDELVKFHIKPTEDGRGLQWENEPADGFNIEITELENNLVKKCLSKLDKENSVPTDELFVRLYKKFMM